MKNRDITSMSREQKEQTLYELTEKLRGLRFRVAEKQLKNVREVRLIRQTIARLLTSLHADSVQKI